MGSPMGVGPSYRVEKMMRGNNYAEAGMRIIKEIVFGRVKAYNLIQMFQFVTMEKYHQYRLLGHSTQQVSARHCITL